MLTMSDVCAGQEPFPAVFKRREPMANSGCLRNSCCPCVAQQAEIRPTEIRPPRLARRVGDHQAPTASVPGGGWVGLSGKWSAPRRCPPTRPGEEDQAVRRRPPSAWPREQGPMECKLRLSNAQVKKERGSRVAQPGLWRGTCILSGTGPFPSRKLYARLSLPREGGHPRWCGGAAMFCAGSSSSSHRRPPSVPRSPRGPGTALPCSAGTRRPQPRPGASGRTQDSS